jgi:hypothetical protein
MAAKLWPQFFVFTAHASCLFMDKLGSFYLSNSRQLGQKSPVLSFTLGVKHAKIQGAMRTQCAQHAIKVRYSPFREAQAKTSLSDTTGMSNLGPPPRQIRTLCKQNSAIVSRIRHSANE